MTRWKLNSDFCKGIKWFLIFTLPLIILLTSTYIWAFNESFYISQFEKNNVYSKFSSAELLPENHRMLEYLRSGAGDFESEFFSTQDKIHLVEVRDLIRNLMYFWIGLSLVWVMLFYICRKNWIEIFVKAGKVGLGYGLLSLIIFVNFDFFFTLFHLMFFEGFNWILDPLVDKLVNMFPIIFFVNIVVRIMVSYLILCFVSYLIGINSKAQSR